MRERENRCTDSVSLLKMLDLGAERDLWEPEELELILDHQLASPLEFDVIGVEPGRVEQLLAKTPTEPVVKTFGDLLFHPRPPVRLLEMVKEFARASRGHPDRPLPDEVASVIYLASIVVALTRCGKRITGLSDDGLRHGLAWALRQTWMHGRIGKLLKEGRRALVDPESAV